MKKKKCMYCGNIIRKSAKYCHICGKALPVDTKKVPGSSKGIRFKKKYILSFLGVVFVVGVVAICFSLFGSEFKHGNFKKQDSYNSKKKELNSENKKEISAERDKSQNQDINISKEKTKTSKSSEKNKSVDFDVVAQAYRTYFDGLLDEDEEDDAGHYIVFDLNDDGIIEIFKNQYMENMLCTYKDGEIINLFDYDDFAMENEIFSISIDESQGKILYFSFNSGRTSRNCSSLSKYNKSGELNLEMVTSANSLYTTDYSSEDMSETDFYTVKGKECSEDEFNASLKKITNARENGKFKNLYSFSSDISDEAISDFERYDSLDEALESIK